MLTGWLAKMRLIWVVLAIAAIVSILMMWGVTAYQFPYADDFCRTVDGHDAPGNAFIRSVRQTAQTYMDWSGRWSTFFVHYLLLGSMDVLRDYAIALLLLSALQLVAAAGFFRFVLELSAGRLGWQRSCFTRSCWLPCQAAAESIFSDLCRGVPAYMYYASHSLR